MEKLLRQSWEHGVIQKLSIETETDESVLGGLAAP